VKRKSLRPVSGWEVGVSPSRTQTSTSTKAAVEILLRYQYVSRSPSRSLNLKAITGRAILDIMLNSLADDLVVQQSLFGFCEEGA
jgi:hypothetical protein